MKKIFTCLLICFLTAPAYFFFQFAKDYRHFQRLKIFLPVHVKDWQIKELENGKFTVQSSYFFNFEGSHYHQLNVFSKEFITSHAAFEFMKGLSKRDWHVWVDPTNPNIASLEKKFPLFHGLKSLLSISILFYLIASRSYLFKKFSI
ncbi:MAG: hypothetical protein PVI40_01855 [Chlamydiota bacterium]|jgi:hypothetical protein